MAACRPNSLSSSYNSEDAQIARQITAVSRCLSESSKFLSDVSRNSSKIYHQRLQVCVCNSRNIVRGVSVRVSVAQCRSYHETSKHRIKPQTKLKHAEKSIFRQFLADCLIGKRCMASAALPADLSARNGSDTSLSDLSALHSMDFTY